MRYIVLGKSYSKEDVPKTFVISILLDTDNIVDQISKGILEGVKGISAAKRSNFKNFYRGEFSKAFVVMPALEVLKLNKLSKVMYDNLEYFISDSFKNLKRIYNGKSLLNGFSNILQKMQSIAKNSSDEDLADFYHKVNYFDLSSLAFDIDKNFSVKSFKDLSKKLYDMTLNKIQEMYSNYEPIPFDKFTGLLREAFIEAISKFSDEKEWVVKEGKLKLPKKSVFYVTELDRNTKDWEIKLDKTVQEIEKHYRVVKLNKKNIQKFIDFYYKF